MPQYNIIAISFRKNIATLLTKSRIDKIYYSVDMLSKSQLQKISDFNPDEQTKDILAGALEATAKELVSVKISKLFGVKIIFTHVAIINVSFRVFDLWGKDRQKRL